MRKIFYFNKWYHRLLIILSLISVISASIDTLYRFGYSFTFIIAFLPLYMLISGLFFFGFKRIEFYDDTIIIYYLFFLKRRINYNKVTGWSYYYIKSSKYIRYSLEKNGACSIYLSNQISSEINKINNSWEKKIKESFKSGINKEDMRIFFMQAIERKFITILIFFMAIAGPLLILLMWIYTKINFWLNITLTIFFCISPLFLVSIYGFYAFKREKYFVGNDKITKIMKKSNVIIFWKDVIDITTYRKNLAVFYDIKSQKKQIRINNVVFNKYMGFKEFIEEKTNMQIGK